MSQTINLLTPTQEQDEMMIDSLNDNETASSASGSTCSQTRQEDQIFDQIEDILCDYMRDSTRHYLQYRILRWAHDDDRSKVFTAIVVINPPMPDVPFRH